MKNTKDTTTPSKNAPFPKFMKYSIDHLFPLFLTTSLYLSISVCLSIKLSVPVCMVFIRLVCHRHIQQLFKTNQTKQSCGRLFPSPLLPFPLPANVGRARNLQEAFSTILHDGSYHHSCRHGTEPGGGVTET